MFRWNKSHLHAPALRRRPGPGGTETDSCRKKFRPTAQSLTVRWPATVSGKSLCSVSAINSGGKLPTDFQPSTGDVFRCQVTTGDKRRTVRPKKVIDVSEQIESQSDAPPRKRKGRRISGGKHPHRGMIGMRRVLLICGPRGSGNGLPFSPASQKKFVQGGKNADTRSGTAVVRECQEESFGDGTVSQRRAAARKRSPPAFAQAAEECSIRATDRKAGRVPYSGPMNNGSCQARVTFETTSRKSSRKPNLGAVSQGFMQTLTTEGSLEREDSIVDAYTKVSIPTYGTQTTKG